MLAVLSWVIGKAVGRRFIRFQSQIRSDFNELEKTKNQLQYLALHDDLTDLPNRLFLIDFIEQKIKQSLLTDTSLAIMFVDIDDFKKVNDAFGHSTGDELLKVVAKRFESLLDQNSIVARFGGDEFVFCFSGLASAIEAEHKGMAVYDAFHDTFAIKGKSIASSCSVGVALFPQDAKHAEDLISKADTALYTSKARQKGGVLFYDESINQQVQYELTLEEELRGAMERDELYMLYQPQIHLETGKLVSVEALIRWNNAT